MDVALINDNCFDEIQRKIEEKLMVQRLLRLIARRMKVRKHVSPDSFFTREQLQEFDAYSNDHDSSAQAQLPSEATPADAAVWTHYCRFLINRSYLCDSSILSKPSPSQLGRNQKRSVEELGFSDHDDMNYFGKPSSPNSSSNNMFSASRPAISSPVSSAGAGSSSPSSWLRRHEVSVPSHLQHLKTTNTPTPNQYPHHRQAFASTSPMSANPNNYHQQPKLDRHRAFLKPPSLSQPAPFNMNNEAAEEDAVLPVRQITSFLLLPNEYSYFVTMCSHSELVTPWFLLFSSAGIHKPT
jgi:hypothetical protein